MAVMSRLLPLAAFSTFAIFLLALLATPTNALANEPYAHVARGHDSIAKRKRNAVKRAKRCRPKTSSLISSSTAAGASYTPAPTSAAGPTSAPYGQSQSKTSSYTPTTTKAPTTTKVSTSSAVATTSVSSGGGGSGGGIYGDGRKLIYSWPNGDSDLAKWKSPKCAGIYTWSPFCPAKASSLGIDCFQMLWGAKQASDFASQTSKGPSKLIFGLNEPNQGDQSNTAPADAAGLWKQYIQPLAKKGSKLVTPATTSNPNGLRWMQDFMAACNGCTFDFVAIHWYDVKADALKAYAKLWHDTFGLPIIVSEYACQNFNGGAQCTTGETWAFHQEMRDWFESTSYIAGYAPFGMMHDLTNVNYDNQMMNSDGSPNALGLLYIGN